MKIETLEKIQKTIEILAAPIATAVAVWTQDTQTIAIVSGTFVLAISVIEYLKLFCKAFAKTGKE